MKTYTVTVTATGGAWRSMKRRYDVTVDAPDKSAAGSQALDRVESNLKQSRENDYEHLNVTRCVVAR